MFMSWLCGAECWLGRRVMGGCERLRERLSDEVVYDVEGERRRRRRADDALAVEVAGERWCLSRVRRLR